MKKILTTITVVAILLVLGVNIGMKKGIFDSLSKVMFSEVTGQVLNNGNPVSGAEVTREYTWAWTGEKNTEVIKTDANGKFHFGVATKKNLLSSILPHEPDIMQTINIKHGGDEFAAFMNSKHDYDLNGELNGESINLKCELTEKESHSEKGFYGICKFVEEASVTYTYDINLEKTTKVLIELERQQGNSRVTSIKSESSDKQVIEKMINLISKLPKEGDQYKKISSDVAILRVLFIQEDGKRLGVKFYDGKIQAPNTAFYGSDLSEEKELFNLANNLQ